MLTRFLLFAALAACAAFPAAAQTAPQASPAKYRWERLQYVLPGSRIYVDEKIKINCLLVRADATSLTCAESKSGPPITLERSGIKSVKLAHRTRSTWSGFGIGYIAGAAIGSATSSGSGRETGGGAGAVLGMIVGSLTGHFTDFTRSTIYKAP